MNRPPSIGRPIGDACSFMCDQYLIEKIEELKADRNAIILAHNYQRDDVQALADYTGDSLGLSIQASKTAADVIVFCGVQFMAETASILCPEKTVLIPDPGAGCPMADMITVPQLQELKARHPGAVVVTYVNSSADVKAETDVCCTSSNAVKVVQSLDRAGEIIFVPDQYLGSFVARQTGRDMILWQGYCPTHMRITPEHIQRQRASHPEAEVLVHPECSQAVVALADHALSTEGICRRAHESAAREFIIGTELGIMYRLTNENPGKTFYPASEFAVCPNMKKITLEKILWCLEGMQHEVRVPEDIRLRARQAVDRMIAAV